MASNLGNQDGDDLGDMFLHAFNNGVHDRPQTQIPMLATGDTHFSEADLDAAVSSPEGMAIAQDHVPGHETRSGSNGTKLNPRSCVICRRRKVRCDKHEPCSNCVKAGSECTFPPPGRAPRKPRRPQDAELLKRLRRLESVVDTLGANVDDDGSVRNESVSGGRTERKSISDGGILEDLSIQGPSRRASLEYGLGKLLIKEGRSRYVSNDFWSSVGEEIAGIRNVLDSPSSDEDEDPPTPETANDPSHRYTHHQGFIFGYSSLMYDMAKLYPNPSQIFILWETFKENVDPVLKLVHVPTVKNVIMKAAVSASSLSKASEALFYSICFASVVAMTDDQCKQLMGDEKNKLMAKYRFAVEQGFARAGFLNSSNLMVLQALVMFLNAVKVMDTSRSIWALSGMAMQQAQAQGLHRDGSNFQLTPFDTEMRRRLWWHINLQSARASEDHGVDPIFHAHQFDTRLPLNVNDEDIWPEMTEPPRERPGSSDMTFCLIRFELSNIQRKLRIMCSSETDADQRRNIKEKEQLIDATHQQMQDKYFQHCDSSIPFLYVASTVGKLILAKMWLFVHHPCLLQDDSQKKDELRRQVLITSVEVVEFGVLLVRGKHTSKWSWLFKTYMQWHAIAYVLSELSHMPAGPEFDRAWNAVDTVYDNRMLELSKAQRNALWRPLKQLYNQAKTKRTLFSNSISPNNNSDSNSPWSTDSAYATQPPDSTSTENWLVSNPYGANVVSATGDAFGLDFNDPVFNEQELASMDGVSAIPNGGSQVPPIMQTSIDSLPFGWTPEIIDYDFGVQNQQMAWQPRLQQEWH